MNILFFLTPKSDVAYIFEDETLRQTVEKMEHRKFSCIPILNKEGKYTGTISEGDLLWGIKRLNINITDLKQMEDVSIMAIPRRATYKPVHADADMENLLDRAINQNYVPVIDDKGSFIGIITRKEIIKYCYKEMKELSSFVPKWKKPNNRILFRNQIEPVSRVLYPAPEPVLFYLLLSSRSVRDDRHCIFRDRAYISIFCTFFKLCSCFIQK